MINEINRRRIRCDYQDLRPLERLTCEILENARRPLSTNEVADCANMSWSTAKKHLEKLSLKDIGVCRNRRGRTDFWFIGECKR